MLILIIRFQDRRSQLEQGTFVLMNNIKFRAVLKCQIDEYNHKYLMLS